MISRILVPLDGSPLSERVFPLVRFLSTRPANEIPVELLRCYEPIQDVYFIPDLSFEPSSLLPEETIASLTMQYLERRKSNLHGLEVSVRTVCLDPAGGILNVAAKDDLIVMSSHGRGGLGRWLMGSVASKVVRGAAGPVLVVGASVLSPDGRTPHSITKILVGIDGSPAAERALELAVTIAESAGAKVLLYAGVSQLPMVIPAVVEANETQLKRVRVYLNDLAANFSKRAHCDVDARGIHGSPGILQAAIDHRSDLIVLGSHGESGLVRWLLGSHTEDALNRAHCPVLVAR